MKALDEYFLMVVFVLLLNRLQVKQVEHKNQIMSLLREQFHYFYNSPLFFHVRKYCFLNVCSHSVFKQVSAQRKQINHTFYRQSVIQTYE